MTEKKRNQLNEVRVKLIPGGTLLTEAAMKDYWDAIDMIIEEYKDYERGYLLVLCLDICNYPINYSVVSMGTPGAVTTNVKEIMRTALLSCAERIVILQNSPNGGLEASKRDLEMHNEILDAAETLGIHVLGHVIFNSTGKIRDVRETSLRS